MLMLTSFLSVKQEAVRVVGVEAKAMSRCLAQGSTNWTHSESILWQLG